MLKDLQPHNPPKHSKGSHFNESWKILTTCETFSNNPSFHPNPTVTGLLWVLTAFIPDNCCDNCMTTLMMSGCRSDESRKRLTRET